MRQKDKVIMRLLLLTNEAKEKCKILMKKEAISIEARII